MFAAIALAWASAMVALDRPCDGASDCFDERGPMHPAFARLLALFGMIPSVLAFLLRDRLRPAWSAGLAAIAAAVMSLPLAAQQLPDDVKVWLVPTIAEWCAFASLVVADRARA